MVAGGWSGLAALALRAHFVRLSAPRASVEPPTRGFSTQKVGVKQVNNKIWLVSYMQYDLGYFDRETCRLEPVETHSV